MMCAFMTPVLKSDWEVYETKQPSNKRRVNNNNTLLTVESAPEMSPSRAQKLERLRQVQEAQRRLLSSTGRSMSYTGPAPVLGGGPAQHRSYNNLSTAQNRARIPISPLALENTNRSKNKGSNSSLKGSNSTSSLSSFHNKVLDKLKHALHISSPDNNSSPDQQQQQQQEEREGQKSPERREVNSNRRRGSRSRLSSRNSFEIPRITEEIVNEDGTLVAAS